MVHSFGVQFSKHCNCGMTLGVLQDSNVLRDVNFDFYNNLMNKCCWKKQSYYFPCSEGYDDSNAHSAAMSKKRIYSGKK